MEHLGSRKALDRSSLNSGSSLWPNWGMALYSTIGWMTGQLEESYEDEFPRLFAFAQDTRTTVRDCWNGEWNLILVGALSTRG